MNKTLSGLMYYILIAILAIGDFTVVIFAMYLGVYSGNVLAYMQGAATVVIGLSTTIYSWIRIEGYIVRRLKK